MSQHRHEGDESEDRQPWSSLGDSSLGSSRDQPAATSPAESWPAYPPSTSRAYDETPVSGAARPTYGETPVSGAAPPTFGATPPAYPTMPEYGANTYQVEPYAPVYGSSSPYGVIAQPHPRSSTALALGIVGVTLCPVAGFAGLAMGNRARKEIDAEPHRYSGRGAATAGYVLGIISIVFAVLWVLFFILLGVGMASA